MSLKHQYAGKSAHPINIGKARWSSGCRRHGSPREFGIGSIRQPCVGRDNPVAQAKFCEEPMGKAWAKKIRTAITHTI